MLLRECSINKFLIFLFLFLILEVRSCNSFVFVVGTVVGVCGLSPEWLDSVSDVSFYALCALMFLSG